jgi:mRNA interferase MazF
VVKKYIPKRGDLVWTDFDPTTGKEQALKRPAIVLSPEPFNAAIQLALVAPITSKVRGHGFEVLLSGTKIKGAVLCQQVKTINYESLGVEFIEKAPTSITDDVLAKVRILVS